MTPNPTDPRRAFSVNVFLPGGNPEGLKVVEKSNWTGRGLVIPRAMFGESKHRDELNRTGVYLLVGPDETSALPRLYVGEGDPVKARLEQHANKRDFWTHAVIFTSKDTNLNKAHVQLLESRLVELAQAAKRCKLDNAVLPGAPSLSESEEATVEGFLDDLLLCLPLLGYSLFETADSAPTDKHLLILNARGIKASGRDTAAGFVVYKGSQAVPDENITASTHEYLRSLRVDLQRQGVLITTPDGPTLILSQDYTFNSPSTASGAMLGRVSNGRTAWKTDDGRTLKEIQDAEAAA